MNKIKKPHIWLRAKYKEWHVCWPRGTDSTLIVAALSLSIQLNEKLAAERTNR